MRDVFADIPRGIYLVRGENVLLLGEIDLDKDDHIPEPFRRVTEEEAHEMEKRERTDREKKGQVQAKELQKLGFEIEHVGETLF